MVSYLLDTNHASPLMALTEPLVTRIEQAQARGHQFGISVTVMGELYHAVYGSQRRAENLRYLTRMLTDMALWEYDPLAAEEFGRILVEQRAIGRPIPPMDAQIAAVVRVNGLTLLTADRHFSFVAGLTVENWLS